MNSWKSLLGAALCLTAIAACDDKSIGPSTDVPGKINTGNGFSFVNSDGKEQTLAANQVLDSVLRLGQKASELDITLSDGTVQSIMLPKLTSAQDGSFKIGGSDSDQRFDSVGAVSVATANSDRTHTDSCVLSYDSQYVCNYASINRNLISSLAAFEINANRQPDPPGSSPGHPIPGGPGPGYNPPSPPPSYNPPSPPPSYNPPSPPPSYNPPSPPPSYNPPSPPPSYNPPSPPPSYNPPSPPPSYNPPYSPEPGHTPNDPIPGGPGPGYNNPSHDPEPGHSPHDPIPGGPGPGYNNPPQYPEPGHSPHDPIPGGPGPGYNNPPPYTPPYTPPPYTPPYTPPAPPVQTCSYEDVPVYGSEVVHEIVQATDKNVNISFNDSATQQSLASFTGSLVLSTQDLSTSTGSCQ